MRLSVDMRRRLFYTISIAALLLGAVLSLASGRYPLTFGDLLAGDPTALGVLFNLRLSRTVMAAVAGFGLSVAGYVFQTMFKNPIASPDIMGVSSGACVGAGVGIIFFGGATLAVALCAFGGGLVAVVVAIALAGASGGRRLSAFVLSGIAVGALAQAVLMMLKRTADPEHQLAELEFWTMGSLAAVTLDRVLVVTTVAAAALCVLFMLHRRITLLSLNSDEAKMLGVAVTRVRYTVLILTTLVVGSIVALTGLITFVGLLGPHITRLALKRHSIKTMMFSGVTGASLLLFADSFARGVSSAEIPISIFTSLLGAPLLIVLVIRGGRV